MTVLRVVAAHRSVTWLAEACATRISCPGAWRLPTFCPRNTVQMLTGLVCRPPFVSIDTSRPPQSQFMGLVIELLPVLFSTASGLGNVTFDFYAFPNLGGEKFQNGTWNGDSALTFYYCLCLLGILFCH